MVTFWGNYEGISQYQAGIKASFSSTLSGHFGVGYSHGAGVESPWNAVAGVNWSF
ncbi:autotransporter outer membrane beta-barrel domain-containing protein [Escherichia coli]|nr:autotransporter outer membrane beta-barrel domain-containing protein [Escherichia coli]